MRIREQNRPSADAVGTVQVRIGLRDSRAGRYVRGNVARCFTVYDVSVNALADFFVQAIARDAASKLPKRGRRK